MAYGPRPTPPRREDAVPGTPYFRKRESLKGSVGRGVKNPMSQARIDTARNRMKGPR